MAVPPAPCKIRLFLVRGDESPLALLRKAPPQPGDSKLAQRKFLTPRRFAFRTRGPSPTYVVELRQDERWVRLARMSARIELRLDVRAEVGPALWSTANTTVATRRALPHPRNMTKLARYRELMRTLDPQGDPRAALTSGWCVGEGPRAAFATKIARRLELEPASQHLVLGGIGSGKTTELWRIHAELEASAEETGARCECIDVSAVHRLDRMKPGVLVALVGLRLIQSLVSTEFSASSARIRELAEGYEYRDETHRNYNNYVPGVLNPNELGPVQSYGADLRNLRNGRPTTFLIDSLDRMPTNGFEDAVREDLEALRLAGIGIVLVGPMRLLYERTGVTELFGANIHSLPEVEPVDAGLAFLTQALRQRVPLEVMSDDVAEQLARASGGVMRDLIALAKGAAQEAYVEGASAVSATHVAAAIDQHGRVSAVGLDSGQVGALRLIREKGTMVIRDERDIALLERRRVLDYGGGRFAVHPALAPLLEFMQAAA